MMRIYRVSLTTLLLLFIIQIQAEAFQTSYRFTLENVFDLEYAGDPQISPDGSQVVYACNFMDLMADQRRSNLWIINFDGTRNQPLTSGNNNNFLPRWSPGKDRLLYASTKEGGGVELYIRWIDTAESAKITNLTESPGGLSWSPGGEYIAFTVFVPNQEQPMVSLSGEPEGAEWAAPAKMVDELVYRADGQDYLEEGYPHVFVIPAEGVTPPDFDPQKKYPLLLEIHGPPPPLPIMVIAFRRRCSSMPRPATCYSKSTRGAAPAMVRSSVT